MDIMDRWEKALKGTEIIRSRIHPLSFFEATELPYIFLAESAVNTGDSVVRKGKVFVEKPSVLLPENIPQLEGFDFDKEPDFNEDTVINFLIVRGVRFPSYRYNNKTNSLDIFEGRLKNAIDHFSDELQKSENVHSGLIVGPEDCWQFSILIFICAMVARSADKDIKRLLDDFEKRRGMQ
jgi:hypothetical protein